MTPKQLAEIEARAARARLTLGLDAPDKYDACHESVADIPALLTALRERDAEIERLRKALAPYALVRAVDGTYVWCSECKQYIDDPGHRKGCVLEGVLKP